MSKIYMIVTNDDFETPVKCDVIGAQAVADYMGVSLQYLREMLCGAKPWSKKQKYKAVCMGEAGLAQKHHNLWAMTHDRTEYYRQYYLKRKHRKAGAEQR